MVSNIDETKPATGIDQPIQVVRDNFGFAKLEIEALQSEKLDRNGDIMLGVLQFAPITLASLPDPTATPGGMLFVTDGSPIAPFFSDGTSWISVVDPTNLFSELADDLTPQLGGDLDLNGKNITEGTTFKWDGINTRLSINTDVQTLDTLGLTIGVKLNVVKGIGLESINFAIGAHNDVTATGPILVGYRSRGTEAAPAVVQSGDEVFDITGLGYDGTEYASAAKITMEIDGTPGTNDMPGRIVFWVSPDGSEILSEALRIESDGTLSVQGTTNYENLVTNDDDIPNKRYVDVEVASIVLPPPGFRIDPGPVTAIIPGDGVVVLSSGGPGQTASLPPAGGVLPGTTFTLKNGPGNSATVIAPAGGDTIDAVGGPNAGLLVAPFAFTSLVSDGAVAWFVI